MEKGQFVQQFVVTFLAARVAQGYDDACVRGMSDCRHLMVVEDAESLAENAWDQGVRRGCWNQQ